MRMDGKGLDGLKKIALKKRMKINEKSERSRR